VDSIIRALVVYAFLLLIFRISGKRTLSQITTFDAVLVLIISESIQQALIDNDNSLTNAFLLVITLVGLDILMSVLKQRSPSVAKYLEGTPVVVIERGRPHRDRMEKERVDEAEILSSAREHEGLARLDEIDYAVVEQSGKITVVPKKSRDG
jgi:uncharacterized membrane protein YcaP (DUF421 family)